MDTYLEFPRSQILKWRENKRSRSLSCLQRKEVPWLLALLHITIDTLVTLVVASLASLFAPLISFHIG